MQDFLTFSAFSGIMDLIVFLLYWILLMNTPSGESGENCTLSLDALKKNSAYSQSFGDVSVQQQELRNLREQSKQEQEQQLSELYKAFNAEANFDITAEKQQLSEDLKKKNNTILQMKIPLSFKGKPISDQKIQSLADVLSEACKNPPEEKIQIIIESIHTSLATKLNLDGKREGFSCWSRALLLYQIFKEYKKELWIEKSDLALPYGHVMNIITLKGKRFLADAGAGCFNCIDGISHEFEDQDWKICQLKKPVMKFSNPESGVYSFTTFPLLSSLGDDQNLYVSLSLNLYEYFLRDRLFQSANDYLKTHSEFWMSHIETIPELKAMYVDKVLAQQEKPLKGILNEGDNQLFNLDKQQQLQRIQSVLNVELTEPQNKQEWETRKKIITELIRQNGRNEGAYALETRDHVLQLYHEKDKNILKNLNLSAQDQQKIFNQLVATYGKENLLSILLKNVETNFDITLWTFKHATKIIEEPLLNEKLLWYLQAKIMQANQMNTDLQSVLAQDFWKIAFPIS